MKFWSKYKTFHSWKCIWKYRLRNSGHFDRGRWVKSMQLINDVDQVTRCHTDIQCMLSGFLTRTGHSPMPTGQWTLTAISWTTKLAPYHYDAWRPQLGLLTCMFSYLVFEDGAPVDEIYGYLIFELQWLGKNETLQWRHNGRTGVSNHQHRDSLLNRLFRRRSKKASKLRVTGLCARDSLVTGEFPAQMASNTENVSISWRHHDGTPVIMSALDTGRFVLLPKTPTYQ